MYQMSCAAQYVCILQLYIVIGTTIGVLYYTYVYICAVFGMRNCACKAIGRPYIF